MMLCTYARKKIDISWGDIWELLDGSWITHRQHTHVLETELDKLWSPNQTLVTFTVRSGFDLCLQACSFPSGSEVIVSAVTIPDMVRIIEHHDLQPIPVDIQEDGSVELGDILQLITSRMKAIPVAHLFGNRMDFEIIALEARRRGVFVFEDCAEAFSGREYTGCSEADVSMFSFGLIKTSTALGGA
jgi:perosamine synthetase